MNFSMTQAPSRRSAMPRAFSEALLVPHGELIAADLLVPHAAPPCSLGSIALVLHTANLAASCHVKTTSRSASWCESAGVEDSGSAGRPAQGRAALLGPRGCRAQHRLHRAGGGGAAPAGRGRAPHRGAAVTRFPSAAVHGETHLQHLYPR